MTAVAPDERTKEQIDAAQAVAVLRRALRGSPALRKGVWLTVLAAMATAAGKVAVPILVERVIDSGVRSGFSAASVARSTAVAVAVIAAVYLVTRITQRRLARAAQQTLYELRTKAFEHIHRLSLAAHADARRGVWLARVTSDVETIERFLGWGAVAWIIDPVLVVVVLAVMAFFSWQLAIVAAVVTVVMVPFLRAVQRRQLRAYDQVREAVGGTMGEVSEAVMGAATIRAYGLEGRARGRIWSAVDDQYQAHLRATRFVALSAAVTDLFGSVALAAVAAVGAFAGRSWGLEVGELVACLFLVSLLQSPVAELGEILDQTQVAVAGWRKVLDVLDLPLDLVEPTDGVTLPAGALAVAARDVSFRYAVGPLVLRGVDVDIAAGTHVAVVGETGSGKTTFAKLLCRLADPTEGAIVVGGQDLRRVDPASRRSAVLMVPQDGFLFDGTVGANVALGAPGASPEQVTDAFIALRLGPWLATMPQGLDTPVGERGESLSVGERQLVALARAQLADPGLLVLDEATSAVDPETERSLARALDRLSEGRTTVTIAHRLAVAEAAEVILVFAAGRLVEVGGHDELVAAGGTYAGLHHSWLGGTRGAGMA